jgi:hypothetical protein
VIGRECERNKVLGILNATERRSQVAGQGGAGRRSKSQVAGRRSKGENVGTSQGKTSGRRDVVKGDKERGKCGEVKGQRILIGTVENAEGSHLDLAQRLSIVERRSRFRIVSEIRSRHLLGTSESNRPRLS